MKEIKILMKWTKTTQWEQKKPIYSEISIKRESATIICIWHTQKQAQGTGKLNHEKTEGCWYREAGGRITRSRASFVIGLGNIFGFFWLVLRWKWRQKLETLSVFDQALTILGLLIATKAVGQNLLPCVLAIVYCMFSLKYWTLTRADSEVSGGTWITVSAYWQLYSSSLSFTFLTGICSEWFQRIKLGPVDEKVLQYNKEL